VEDATEPRREAEPNEPEEDDGTWWCTFQGSRAGRWG
jgi:hypothetical protein